MPLLSEIFKTLDLIFKSCDIDYEALTSNSIQEEFFNSYENQRIVNSFLFNFSKLQDKIGARLIKKVLFEQKEINDEGIPMLDALNLLEKLKIIEKTEDFERLREIRNALAHDYPLEIQERITWIKLALQGYQELKKIYQNLKKSGIVSTQKKNSPLPLFFQLRKGKL